MSLGLGKPKPHSAREIRERREKELLLMAKGCNQQDIAHELGISRMTINRDMHYINEMTNKGLFDIARASFSTMYYNCVDGFNEIMKECWKIYYNADNDPHISQWHKIAALRLAADIQEKKFRMFQDGPAVMDLNRMHDEVEELKKIALEDSNTFTTRYLPSPHKDVNINDLNKP